MESTKVKKEPRDDRSDTVLGQLASSATKDKKSEKLGRSDGDASGTDDTNDHDSNSGSDEDEEESDVYEVEKVVGHRREQAAGGGGNVLFYHIKWKDYPDSDSTWEISSQVFCKDMVDEYWKQYLDLGGKKTDPYGDLKKQTSSLLSLNGKRKLDPSSSSATHSGKGGSKSGKASGRSGSISEEPLLPDLSPLVKSSSAAAVATTARGAQGGTQSTSFKRARTNSPERQQSTMVTISTSATSTLTASSTVAKSSRKESVPRKLTSVGPVLITDENWTPPDNWNTWDDHVERVEAIETRSLDRHDKSTMFVHLRWKTGNRFTLHPLSEIHIKAPHKLIEFYERHLQFQESSNA